MRQNSFLLFSFLFITLACIAVVSDSPISGYNYTARRESALKIQPTDIDVSSDLGEKTPYGIVMDTTIMPGYTETLISYSNGYSDLLFGDGRLGTNKFDYKPLESKAIYFVNTAKRFVDYMDITTEFPLPKEGKTIIYVLTPSGIYTSGEFEDIYPSSNGKVSLSALSTASGILWSTYRGLE